MRALTIFLAATTLMTAVGTAQAQSGSTGARQITAEEMTQVSGAYRLNDGRRADLFTLNGQLYIRIGRGQQQELQAAGPSRFTSIDGKITIRFESDLNTDRIVLEHDRGVGRQDSTIRLALNERPGRGSAD